MTARVPAFAAAVLGALTVTACGSSSLATLNTIPLARAIQRSILHDQGIPTTVACPSSPPQKAGYRFVCSARLAVGTYAVDAIETDARGGVRFLGTTALRRLNIPLIERTIERELRRHRRQVATVRCPGPVLEQAGLAFTCTAQTGRGPTPFVVSETDGSGRVRFVEH